jgi:hypothetical protein
MTKRRYRRSQNDPLASLISIALALAILSFLWSSFWKSPYFIPVLCLGIFVIAIGLGLMILIRKLWRDEREDETAGRISIQEYHLESAWQRAMHDLFPNRSIGDLPRDIRVLGYTNLELLAANVYNRSGYQATHQGGANDGGIDVLLHQSGKPVGVVQCKQYTEPIGPKYVRELNGTIGASLLGYLWSPSGFTDKAKETADHMPRIKLLGKSAILAQVEQAYLEPIISSPQPTPKAVIPASTVLSQPAITAAFQKSIGTPPTAPSPNINLRKDFPITRPGASKVASDPLTVLVKDLAKRSGLTLNQVQILFAILLLGIMATTVMAVLAITTNLR